MTPTWNDASRILCVRLDNLGDVLMSMPAMRALKRARPGRHLTLMASPSGAALAPFLPDIDETIVYHAPWVKNEETRDEGADLALIHRLRGSQFDAAVIFTVYSQSALPAALTCRLAGIPLILAHARENPYQLLTEWATDQLPEDGGRHEVQRQLDLVASVGARIADISMSMEIPASARHSLRQKLEPLGIMNLNDCIVVHPGATAASRRYPADKFAQVVRALAHTPRTRVLVTGGRSEQALTAQVCSAAKAPVIDLAGRLTLGELAALIEGASVLVSNNSGPVHIAAALGTPVVDLYAQTNLQHTPWQVEHRLLYQEVPCKNCYRSVCPEGHHACLDGVKPDAVVQAAHELRAGRIERASPPIPGSIAA